MIDEDKHYFERILEISSEFSNLRQKQLNERPAQWKLRGEWTCDAWAAAVSIDAGRPTTFELAALWAHTRSGRWHFVDMHSTAERYFALLRQLPLAQHSRMRERNLTVLQNMLLGQPAKVTAIESGVAISTVASYLQDALRWMGLSGRIANVPVMLTMAARAACAQPARPTNARLTRITSDADAYWLVSVRRPDLEFPVRLSQAEAVVVRQFVAGHTHAEISIQRSTSRRTVANQLATVFRKLGVSGRGELIQELITHSLNCPSGLVGIQGSASTELRA